MHRLSVSTYGAEEKAAILEVAESGNFTMGARCAQFEREFAQYIGTKYCVMVNSGSSANLLMVAAYTLRYGKGSVIVPAVGWSTSYAPFQQYGWHLKFVDVDSSLTIDPEQAWRALDEKTETILAINILGNPCDFHALPRKCHILEDNCESLGADYEGRRTGSIGLIGTHSFFFSHHICTTEGGAITTNDPDLHDLLLALRAHGWTRNLPRGTKLGNRDKLFEFVVPGYNVRPTEIQGALGLVQLPKLPGFLAHRRDNAKRFPLRRQKEIGRSSWYGFATEDLRVKRECEWRPVVTGNFTRQPVMSYFDRWEKLGELPMANYVHDEMVMIGNHGSEIDWQFLM